MAAWRRIVRVVFRLLALTIIGLRADWAVASELFVSAPPPSFAELEGPRDVVVDVFYEFHRLGVTRATTSPGSIRFSDPAQVANLLSLYGDPVRIAQELQSALPSNVGKVCSRFLSTDCGNLRPGSIGVIYDEDRFRVDIFLGEELAGKNLTTEVYLSPTSRDFAAIGTIGAALSGTSDANSEFNLQGRAILSFGDVRAKANISYSSQLGAVADDLVLEIDRPDRRYLGGLFWAPGTNLVGRRRVLGFGAATQYDTRIDRQQFMGTPLPVFVQQRSLIEIIVDGRLVASRVVEPGHQLVDTTGLPDGSYPLILRIREPGRETREEHRFFVRDDRLAPPGRIWFQAFVGLIAPTRENHPISVSNDAFYQLSGTKRISTNLGIEMNLLGTQNKIVSETNVSLLTKLGKLRVIGLASTKGEYGGSLQFSTIASGPLQLSFDLRRIWDSDGKGLIPGSFEGFGFDSGSSDRSADKGGDYTQLNATLSYQLGDASVRLFASYNRHEHLKSDFSIGPNIDWMVARGKTFQLRAEADAQKSRKSASAYVGVRFLFTGNGFASSGSSGYRFRGGDLGTGGSIENMNAEWSGSRENLGQYSFGVGIDRESDVTAARARGSIDSRYGNVRADVINNFGNQTQYSLSLQTGIAAGRRVSVGGYNVGGSALVIDLKGKKMAGRFEVLVDEAPAASVSAGERATIFLQPYRKYAVRLRPTVETTAYFDSGVREITLFPGNVERQSWEATETVTVFGRIVDAAGKPIGNGVLQGPHGAGSSDPEGYFQIDVAANDRVTLTSAPMRSCELNLSGIEYKQGYSSVGRVVCQ